MSSTEWEGNYIKPSVELMKVLSSTNKLLFVNSPYTIAEVIATLRGKKSIDIKRALGLKNRIKVIELTEGAKVYLLTPPIGLTINFLPPAMYKLGLGFNAWLVRLTVKRALRKLDMNHNLIHLVAFNPGMGLMNGRKYGEKSLIYHCYDEISGCNAWLRKHGIWLEQAFMKMVDGAIVTSKKLYINKAPHVPHCFIVNNAANYNLFSKGFHEGLTGQQVVGYIGTIDDRIDYGVMEHLFMNMPDARFVFVGRILSQRGLATLKKYTNVSVEGPKSPDELPAYLKTFSVGVIPFVNDTFTSCIYPMKINEYLAAGLPVVSTDFGDMSDFTGTVSITTTKENFLQHTLDEIANDSPEKRQARQDIVRQNTWANRADEMSAAIVQIEQSMANK
ncbi:MAG: glycosyltransferase [Bacteroidota bacterium]